jgi:ABC-type branched-subunit amino acid transport system ATPase component/ABC-type branched-subunit amino acid transport system permease subunit
VFGLAQTDTTNRYWVQIGIDAMAVGISVIGLNLLLGYTGLLSLGHYAFFVYGGFAGAIWAVEDWGLDPWFGFPVAFALGMLFGALLALTCCHLRGFYLTVVTLAFGLLASSLAVLLDGLFNGLSGRPVLEPLDTNLAFVPESSPNRPFVGLYWIGAALLLVCLLLSWNISRSRWGRAFTAIRESDQAAGACGVPTYWAKVLAFALSAGMVSLAGVIAAQQQLQVTMVDGTAIVGNSFELVIDAVVGGLGTLSGPIVGAFVFTFGLGLDFGGESLAEQLGEWETLFLAAVVIAFTILAPQGIVGLVRRALARPARLLQPRVRPVDVATPRATHAYPSGTPILGLDGVTQTFGALAALADVSMTVAAGTIHALIGPNGSGKSTLANAITGVQRPTRGRVLLGDRELTNLPPHRALRAGVARTFQTCQIWRRMSVLENVMVGAHARARGNPFWALLVPPFLRPEERHLRERALGLLEFVGLTPRAFDAAGALPFADQHRLEIARALAADPDLLILDEPAAGMHPGEVQQLVALVTRIRESGITVLLIEHHMEVVNELADHVTVLNFGRIIAEGPPEAIARNPAVIGAYLGEQQREPPEAATVVAERDAGRDATTEPERALLRIEDLSVRYGAAMALARVSLEVRDGEIVALIGANGAGKSTMLKTISGVDELLKSVHGAITFAGHRIDRLPAHRIARLGLVQVPEGRRVFAESTVEENLMLGMYTRGDHERAVELDHVYDRFPVLAGRRQQLAGYLSGGEQQMLAIGRALAAGPRCLLLDEPSLGLAPIVVDQVFETIVGLARDGVTVLLVEQLATRALGISDRAYILETGSIVREGSAAALADDPAIREAYLGGRASAP